MHEGNVRSVGLNHRSVTASADFIMASINGLYHPNAQGLIHPTSGLKAYGEGPGIIEKDPTAFDRIRDWVIDRLHALDLASTDRGELILNPWNKTHQLGLQSVTFAVNRLDEANLPRPALLSDEWKSPTIGAITSGMIDKKYPVPHGKLTGFDVDSGKAEELTAMSDGFPVGGHIDGAMDLLKAGTRIIVSGPHAVQVYIELPAMPDDVSQQVRDAVYACRFLKVV